MRHLIKYLVLLFFAFTMSGCEKERDTPEPRLLSEHFECDINGIPFKNRGEWSCSDLTFNYYPEPYLGISEGYCVLGGRDCGARRGVSIRIDGLRDSTGYLSFIQPAYADSCYPFYLEYVDGPDGNFKLHEKLIDGFMSIEHFYPRASNHSPLGSIQGTFEFSLTNKTGSDTIKITNGRFRFDVPQVF